MAASQTGLLHSQVQDFAFVHSEFHDVLIGPFSNFQVPLTALDQSICAGLCNLVSSATLKECTPLLSTSH